MKEILAAFAFVMIACAPIVKYTPFDSEIRTNSESVDIFMSRESVGREFKEIGLIIVDDEGWDRSETELIEKMRQRAMLVGADALILERSEQKSQGFIPIGGTTFHIVNRIVRGVAIIYL